MKKSGAFSLFVLLASLIVLTSLVSADGWVTVFSDDFNDGVVDAAKWNVNLKGGAVTESGGSLKLSTSGSKTIFPYVTNKVALPKSKRLQVTLSLKYNSINTNGNGFVFNGACSQTVGQVWNGGAKKILFYQTAPGGAYVDNPPGAIHQKTQSPVSNNLNNYQYTFEINGNDYNMSSPFGTQKYFTTSGTCNSPTANPMIFFGNNAVSSQNTAWCSFQVDGVYVSCYSSAEVCDGFDNDCNGVVDDNKICCAGKNCGEDIFGVSCGTCEAGKTCNELSQCILIVPAEATVGSIFWKNKTNQDIITATVNDVVNLTVNGADLKKDGRLLNYTIFKLGGGRVQNFTRTAISNTFDTINFTVTETGNYSFVIKVIGESGRNRSMNLSVAPYPTKYVNCNGTIVDHASWNSFEEAGKFKETWKNNQWSPLEKYAFFDIGSTDECAFSCASGFVWNSTACVAVNPTVVNCSQFITEASCDVADFAHITAAESEFNVLTYERCNQPSLCPDGSVSGVIDCYCKWDAVKKCRAVTTEDQIDLTTCPTLPSCIGGNNFCEYTSQVDGDCNTAGTSAITVTLKSSWKGVAPCTKPAYCVDEAPKNYPCVSTEELPFFGLFNFAVAFVCIGFIYFLVRRKL